jgi:ABC-type lipoprotein export system ATPase subunit
MSGGPLVELRDVFVVHRTAQGDAAALQGVDLDLGAGEVLCVLGPSGAGKSTLLRVIAGLEIPSAGSARLGGRDVGRLSARERARLRHARLGFVGQDAEAAIPPDLRAGEAVAMPLALRGVGARDRDARALELLAAAGLRERADALPAALSGGERQRVALCAALAHRPEILLADEPTGELDEASAASVRGLIVELARAEGAAVIIASHDPAMAEVAGRTVRIRDGRVAEDFTDGDGRIAIGPGGRLQLPQRLLADAGIASHARARLARGGILISPARGEAEAISTPDPADSRDSISGGRQRPARVDLRAVRRSYGRGRAQREVVRDLTWSFAPGRLTALTGRSGSGKTTLLRMIAGLDLPDEGSVLIDDRLPGGDRESRAALRRRRMGYLPQEPWPVGFLSAAENVALALRVRGWAQDAATERAATALAQVRLADRARQRVERLSAGERQRVALARALASARGLLLIDEPTSRLDSDSAAEVGALLASAAAEEGQTVICATHDPQVIRAADDVLALARQRER